VPGYTEMALIWSTHMSSGLAQRAFRIMLLDAVAIERSKTEQYSASGLEKQDTASHESFGALYGLSASVNSV
jgi:hypothetical protein